MKKIFVTFLVSLLLAVIFALSACGNDGEGTYYPENEEIIANLERNDYAIDYNGSINGYYVAISLYYGGSLIKASKGDDYIYFSRLNNSEQCSMLYSIIERECENYNTIVQIENDEKWGNIVYCGTENAVNAAGIKVVKVDVTVKV